MGDHTETSFHSPRASIRVLRETVAAEARAAGFEIPPNATCTFGDGSTLPLEVAYRSPDAFSYVFLAECARAELCFRPTNEQFGHWVANKLASYNQHGADAPCMGRLYWGHTFDFMVVAYEEVNSKPSGEREAAVVARDADPAAHAREWLFNKGAFAPWRLIVEPRGGFELAFNWPEWVYYEEAGPTDWLIEKLDGYMAEAYDEGCKFFGGPKDSWFPECDGSHTGAEERDYFAFRSRIDEYEIGKWVDDLQLREEGWSSPMRRVLLRRLTQG